MSIADQRVTLKIDRPRRPLLVYGLVLFLLMCITAELVARTNLVQSLVPYQAYGTNHTQLELQLNTLEKFVAENGPPDCFIFGSSQAFREVDAGIFTRAFNRLSGETLTCYNFGITGSQIWTTNLLGRILIEEYHPRLVMIGTSFLDYTEGREFQIDERFRENDWLEYQSGKFTLGGWLAEHSYAWRTVTILSYSAPYGLRYGEVLHEARKWNGEIARSGFALSKKQVNPNQPVEDAFVRNLKLEFGNYGVSERNLAALEELIEFSQQAGAQVLMVEMVYQPSLLELKDAAGSPRLDAPRVNAFVVEVNARLEAIAEENKLVFLRFDPEMALPGNGWFDLYHLNRDGARAFSRWLGRQAAGIIDLPPSVSPVPGGN